MAIQEDPELHVVTADIPPVVTQTAGYVEGGRTVDAARGWSWITEGFALFRRHAGFLVVLAIIFFAIVIVFQVMPLIGWLAMTLIVPVLVGGFMAGFQAIESGADLELAHLFVGFRRNTAQLMLVGIIGVALTVAVMLPPILLMGAGSFFAAMSGSAVVAAPVFGMTALLGLLIALALFIPVNMALWFAPALVMLQGQNATRAIRQSFRGCLRNIVPFLIYGVILFFFAMIAAIPLGLGWLILMPVVLGSIYAAYRDIYFRR